MSRVKVQQAVLIQDEGIFDLYEEMIDTLDLEIDSEELIFIPGSRLLSMIGDFEVELQLYDISDDEYWKLDEWTGRIELLRGTIEKHGHDHAYIIDHPVTSIVAWYQGEELDEEESNE